MVASCTVPCRRWRTPSRTGRRQQPELEQEAVLVLEVTAGVADRAEVQDAGAQRFAMGEEGLDVVAGPGVEQTIA